MFNSTSQPSQLNLFSKKPSENDQEKTKTLCGEQEFMLQLDDQAAESSIHSELKTQELMISSLLKSVLLTS